MKWKCNVVKWKGKKRNEQKRKEMNRKEKKRSSMEEIKGKKIEKDIGGKSEVMELSNIQIECSAKVGYNHQIPM